MDAEKLLGAWELRSLRAMSPEGEISYPWGENLSGMLIYLPDGVMTAVLMQSGRPNLGSGLGDRPAEEMRAILQGFDAYCGTYSLDMEAGIVTHHVEAARAPEWVGSHQIRYFELEGDLLSIRTEPMPLYGGAVLLADWRRRY
ncbi:MAG: lipocalin-like domain-containing protein [Candidatus Promineifilaceae bacterium]|nr:lipocalin-like domain-containing protein [Candidatus Promineifilaceae bacterium]